ncbi:MAG: lasso peptide biosynthesis B2 protein [Thermoanaerobaculia bacterium]|nr:lasso peptide biosynthesis B2 protein [Thermoanaerobaculia bacterium]
MRKDRLAAVGERLESMTRGEAKLVARSVAVAIYVKLLIRFGDFSSAVRSVSAPFRARRTDPELCDQADRAVRLAWRLMPARGRCLEQAMTLVIVLRDEGADAYVKLGVRPDLSNFEAHAWVEVPSAGYVTRFSEDWVVVASMT